MMSEAKRLVLEVSPLFGELAIEKVNNMYRLTQEDDMLYFTPSEIVRLTQIEYAYTDKIVSINDEHKIHFYSSCPGFIEAASTEASKNGMQQKVDMSFWDDFLERVYLENHRSYYK
ncbi:hypothetical protein T47t1_101 [Escherichia phage T4]|nr:hypothetical protein T47t1_101 [Escherichia phage T4]